MSGSKILTSDPIAAPRRLPISWSASRAPRVSLAGARDEDGCVRPRSVDLDGGPIGGEAGCVGLEMATSVAVPLAGQPSRDDDDVAEFRPAPVEAVVDDDASADTGAECQHDQVGCAPPRAEPPFGERGRVAVVLDAGRQPEPLARSVGEMNLVKRQVHGPKSHTRAPIDVEWHAVTDRRGPIGEEVGDDAVDRLQHLLLRSVRRRDLDRPPDRAIAGHEPRKDLRPAEIDSDNTLFIHVAATITARMPEQEKPYKVYRGGRAKGRVPLQRAATGRGTRGDDPKTSGKPSSRRIGKRVSIALAVVLLLGVVWLVASYVSVSGSVADANRRVPASVKRELTKRDGLLSSTPTTILVLGTDGGSQAGRSGARRSDSVMLIRTNPRRHQLAFLSIPRDLRVDIPGYGSAKINAAFQFGGPALALRTVKALTGLEVNHVAFVDFDRFRELIDSVGGIDVDVPRPIRSNRFDCPYATAARCEAWPGWRFSKGTHHMDGRRALAYSRVRENLLDPSETDLDRARRQQQVIQATADKVTSLGTALLLPFRGGSIVKPLATDLSAGQMIQLGWAYFRADSKRALHCRLGGEPGTADGESVIFGSEDNVATIAMFMGRSAPLAPPKGLTYAPGCVVGGRAL